MKNAAIFGAGRIGRIHAANLAALTGVTLQYVCDPVTAAASDLAQTLGARVSTIDAVLEDKSIEVAVIAPSTDTRSDLITRSAAAGKHIFCEKPVDMSVPRVRDCAAAVQAAGVACMIGFQRRFDPTFNEARTRMDRGEMGNSEMLVITSRDPGAPPAACIQASGGIVRDMDSTAVTIRTRKGRRCQINTIRRAAYGYDQRFEVPGSAGMLQCGNHTPSEVVQWDAHGVRCDKPENFFLQRYAAAQSCQSGQAVTF